MVLFTLESGPVVILKKILMSPLPPSFAALETSGDPIGGRIF